MGRGPENLSIQPINSFILERELPIQHEWVHDELHPEHHAVFDRLIAQNPDTEYSFDSGKYPELLVGIGEVFDVPRRHLFGTQEVSEFSEGKRKRIEAAFKAHGVAVLEDHPIVACAVPVGRETILAIVDGHHRARYSSKFGIHDIPTQVLSLAELVYVRREYALRKGEPIDALTEEFVARKLLRDVSIAIDSFSHRMPDSKIPVPIPGRSVAEIGEFLQAA